jgi:hypothetical protein
MMRSSGPAQGQHWGRGAGPYRVDLGDGDVEEGRVGRVSGQQARDVAVALAAAVVD